MTWTVLHHACEHLDSKCILERCKTSTSELLEVDDHGSTPLHILAWGNPNLDLLKALVDCCPAAVSDQNVHGDTCLHIACSYPGTDVKVVRLLVDACPGLVSIKNKEGLMPLHVACRCSPENKAVISCLVETYPNALLKPIKVSSSGISKLEIFSLSCNLTDTPVDNALFPRFFSLFPSHDTRSFHC